jgi:membrane-associated phospholipid phosphatase
VSGTPRGASAGWNSGGPLGVGLFLLGCVALVVMSIAAHSLAYFAPDPTISRDVQAYHPGWLDTVTTALSWTGFPPQSDVLFGVVVIVLFVLGARWAAVMEIVAAVGSGGLYLLLQQIVGQPRPSADLVRIAGPVQLAGFPSGHLATFVAVFGFVALLGYRHLSPSPTRWLPPAFVVVLLVLMSFARIYAGQHWASDVLGGWLLGGLWLAVIAQLYWWGKGRFFRAGPERSPSMLLEHTKGAARPERERAGASATPSGTRDQAR